LLIVLMALVVLLFMRKVRLQGLWLVLMWFNITLFSAYFLIITLAHFEVRYFYFPKIAGIVMMIIAVTLYYRPTKKISTVSGRESNTQLKSEQTT